MGPLPSRTLLWAMRSVVGIVEAPDDQTLAAGLLAVAGQGNIRTTTLRAFNADEMKGVIIKVS